MRWLSMLLGVAGTYRQNDSVDVAYESGGKRLVAAELPISRGVGSSARVTRGRWSSPQPPTG